MLFYNPLDALNARLKKGTFARKSPEKPILRVDLSFGDQSIRKK